MAFSRFLTPKAYTQEPGESQPGESQPVEAQPGEAQPGEAQPEVERELPDGSITRPHRVRARHRTLCQCNLFGHFPGLFVVVQKRVVFIFVLFLEGKKAHGDPRLETVLGDPRLGPALGDSRVGARAWGPRSETVLGETRLGTTLLGTARYGSYKVRNKIKITTLCVKPRSAHD